MTDARMPSRWIADRRFLRLPDVHLASYVFALMYAAESRTDGVLDSDDFRVIPRYDQASTSVLVEHGLLEVIDATHWLITDYSATQTSAADLRAQDERRLRARDKKREQRARPQTTPVQTTTEVTEWNTVTIPQ